MGFSFFFHGLGSSLITTVGSERPNITFQGKRQKKSAVGRTKTMGSGGFHRLPQPGSDPVEVQQSVRLLIPRERLGVQFRELHLGIHRDHIRSVVPEVSDGTQGCREKVRLEVVDPGAVGYPHVVGYRSSLVPRYPPGRVIT